MQRTVCIWNLTTYELKYNLSGHSDWILTLAKLDGNLLASGSQDFSVIIWDLANGKQLFKMTGHSFWVFTMAKLDGPLLASRSFGELIIWNVTSGNQVCMQPFEAGLAYPALTRLDGNLLAVANPVGWDSIEIWNATSCSMLFTMKGDYHEVTQLVNLNSGLMASGGLGPSVDLWNVKTGQMEYSLYYEGNSVLASLDDNMLASAKGWLKN